MEGTLLKSAALIAVASLASACAPGKIGTGGSPADTPNGSRRAATSPEHPGLKPDHEPNSIDERTESKAMHSELDIQQPAREADTARRGARGTRQRPWAHNTGPTDPGALVPAGTMMITDDGAVLENLDLTGMVKIDADNVTIRNFRIKGTSNYGIQIVDGHSGILIEDGEIYGMTSTGIVGVGYTARRLYIHDAGADGTKAQGTGGPTLVEYCFMEKLGKNDDAHADGNQTQGGSDITFRYNNIYMPYPGTPNYPGAPYKSNAAFMNSGTISNFVIESNWLTGGNYTIYCKPGISARNNIFGRENGGLSTGKENRRIRSGSCDEWSGNRWEDTGDPI